MISTIPKHRRPRRKLQTYWIDPIPLDLERLHQMFKSNILPAHYAPLPISRWKEVKRDETKNQD